VVLDDFGLALTGVLCFTDFDLTLIRECLLAGRPGVTGVGGMESEAVPVLLIEILRGSADSRMALVCSNNGDLGVDSSATVGKVVFSALLRVNMPLNPPFDSLF
jgi:hypothetical protein